MKRRKIELSDQWHFHLGSLAVEEPMKTVRKAGAIGGLTAPLAEEFGPSVLTGAGGEHFLRLIAQGNRDLGLEMLAGTQLNAALSEAWTTVDLPHDWKNAQPYVNDPRLLMGGSKSEGVGYYRKTFSLNEDEVHDQQLFVRFMGAMRMATEWLNGVFLGEHYSGYSDFSFDITELARYGNEGLNVLFVKVDTTTGAEGWWYEGAGLYREVCLELVPRIRINECDTVVETTSLGTNQARLNVTIGIENQSFANQRDLCVRGSIAGHTEEQAVPEVAAFSTAVCAYTHEVAQPKLWSVETPHLYTARFQLLLNGKVIDEFQQTFGIRTVGYHADGFYLNGRRTELRGVCEHQDFGGVGVAINRDILRYKLLKMKAMGVNAYRSAHHFASPDLLQLCDQLGLMVMNENRVLESSGWRVEELERMVKQTRHHPCQCFWSLCNEEVIGNTPFANRVAKKLAAVIRNSTSQSLIVSAELLNPEGVVDEGYLSNFDVCGVNYPESGVNGAGLSVLKARHPDQRFLSTESASYFSTRGIYKDDAPKCQASNFGSRFSMVLPGERQPDEPGAGGTAHPEEVMGFLQQHPFTGGVFLWTFMDYCGEPAPFPWPGISFQFGITDTAGLEKDYFYYYQSKWQQEPMIHVMPHWNEEGLVFDDNEEIEVRVFSNCSEVELFINDVSCGLKTAGKDYTTWRVPFEAGVLKAIGYKGEHSVEDARITSDPLTSLAISQRYAGEVYDLFEVTGVDQAGVYTPMAEALVSVSVSGGAIVGLANGNPADISEFSLKEKKLFSGKLIVIVKKRAGFSPVISAKIK